MKKSGKVINFDEHKVYIITEEKDFVTLERGDEKPVKGQKYTGYVFEDRFNYTPILVGIIIIALVLLIGIKFIFFSSKASIVVNMYENIKISTNRDKIVSITDVNGQEFSEDGYPSVTGTNLNDGLCLLFDYYYKNELLPEMDQYSPGKIIIFVTKNNKKESLNFDKFTEYTGEYNYNVTVNRNNNELIN